MLALFFGSQKPDVGKINFEGSEILINVAKSLQTYVKNYSPKYSIRLSTRNFGYENNIKSIPLYAVFCLKPE